MGPLLAPRKDIELDPSIIDPSRTSLVLWPSLVRHLDDQHLYEPPPVSGCPAPSAVQQHRLITRP